MAGNLCLEFLLSIFVTQTTYCIMKKLQLLTSVFVFFAFVQFSLAQLQVAVEPAAKCVCNIPANHAKDSVYNHGGVKYAITYVSVTHHCNRSICLVDECKYKLSLRNASGSTSVTLTADCKFATATAIADYQGIGNRNAHPANDELLISALAPNPVSQGQNLKFDVELSEDGGFGIEVYDLTGRVVLSQAFNDHKAGVYETVLFTNKLTKGHYFVKLICNGKVAVKRFSVL